MTKLTMARKSGTNSLDVSGPGPLYKQVEQRILQCLSEGEWKAGEQLPTEGQLAERFGVAVFTIRAGIGELVTANILVRKQGKGTFVARHSRSRQRYQFSHIYDAHGRQILPGRLLLNFGKDTASAGEAARLELGPAEKPAVYRLEMLSVGNTQDGAPVSTLDIVLPAKLFAGLNAAAIRNANENLYAAYQDACGINVIRIEEHIHAALAGAAEARALKIRSGSPVLRVERVARTYNNVPVEFRTRVFDAARYHYRTVEGSL